MNWYNDTLRKIHILYVSPAWAKNQGEYFSAEEYVQGLQTAGVDLVQLYGKDHHGYCYYRARQGRAYPRDLYAELIPAVRNAGMRFVGYFSVGLDAWALGMYPEWSALDRQGKPYIHRHFVRACLNSGYRQFALDQFEDMVANYELDAAWLDIIPLAFPAPGVVRAHQYPLPCFCPACCHLYRERFGDDLPLAPSPEQTRHVYQFMIDGVRSFLEEAKEMLIKHQPEALLTYNHAGSWEDPVGNADLISIEGHAPNYGRQSLISRWGRSGGKPFEILTPGGLPSGLGPNGYGGWNNWDIKPAEALGVEAAITAAHGGSAVFGVAPYPDGRVEPAQWKLLGQVFERVKAVEPYCVDAAPYAEVALILAARPWAVPESGFEQFTEVELYHEILLDSQVQFDILSTCEDLSRYRLVILPNQPALSASEVAAIRSYVDRGGALLVSGLTSLWDEHGIPRKNFGLADVIGADYQSTLEYPISFLKADIFESAGAGLADMPLLTPHAGVVVKLGGGEQAGRLFPPETMRTSATTVLWGTPPPDIDRASPGIVLHRFGQGQCAYIASRLASQGLSSVWTKQLIRQLTAQLLPEPVLSANTPPGTEIVLARQQDRWIIHIIDPRAGDANHIAVGQDRVPIRDVDIDLRKKSVGAIDSAHLADGTPLSLSKDTEHYRVRIPTVDIHEVVVLE